MADTDQVLDLAAIIREVDGNHSKGAAALAESILDHPDFRVVLASWGNAAPVPPARLRNCPTHGQQPPEAWGCPECVMELRKELTALRQQQPQPPADGEVAELVCTLTGIAHWRRRGRPGEGDPSPFDIRQADRLDRAAELLQRQVLVPVSVSERPWEREGWCDAEGKCWICGKVEGDWRLINPTNSGVPNLKYCFTHCLPAHALPLPEVGED